MVTYLLSEYREIEAACGLLENSGANVRMKNIRIERHNLVSPY